MRRMMIVALALLVLTAGLTYAVLVDVWQTSNTVSVGHKSLMVTDENGVALTSVDWGNFWETGQSKTVKFNLTVVGSETVNIHWNVTDLPSCFNLTLATTNGNNWAANTIIRKQPGETVQCTATLTLLNYQEDSFSFTINFYASK